MTRVLLDACVLFPSITRSLLLGIAQAGHFTPLWSDRILGEWQHAALRRGIQTGQMAETEILLLRVDWPQASVSLAPEEYENLVLPDMQDTHVLGAAIKGQAEELVTANLKDFPTRTLARYGIIRRDPDGFLLEFAQTEPDTFRKIIQKMRQTAIEMQGENLPLRPLLRKAGLPRLGKFLDVA
jgi:predicted nucleic acid-binding protein